jgi:hypothetical protein
MRFIVHHILVLFTALTLVTALVPTPGLGAGTAWADTVIFDTTYKARYAGLNVTTERQLIELNDGSYRLESKASNLLGSLTETSHFIKRGDTWLPLNYSYRRRIFGSKTTENIEFDWQRNVALYTHSAKADRNTEHSISPGILDPALYQLRLQRDLVQGIEQLDYRFIKRDRIRHYQIERGASEPLKVNGKAYRALRLQRSEPEDDKQTYVWTLPELFHLLGKIVHVEDDDDHELVLVDHDTNHDLMTQFFSRHHLAGPTSSE